MKMKHWAFWVGLLIVVVVVLVGGLRPAAFFSTIAPPDPFTIVYEKKSDADRSHPKPAASSNAGAATVVAAQPSAERPSPSATASASPCVATGSASQVTTSNQTVTPQATAGTGARVRHYPVTWASPGYRSCRRLFYTAKHQANLYGGLGLMLGLLFTCVVGKVSVRLVAAEGTLAKQRSAGMPTQSTAANEAGATGETERNILKLLWNPMIENPGTFLVVLGAVLGPASYYALSRSSTAAGATEAATRAMGRTDDLEMHSLCAEAEASWLGSKAETNTGFMSKLQQSVSTTDGGQP
jgi:hypothetical protein